MSEQQDLLSLADILCDSPPSSGRNLFGFNYLKWMGNEKMVAPLAHLSDIFIIYKFMIRKSINLLNV